MENKLQITNISGVDCYEKDGMAYLKLEAVARGLGFTDNSKGVEYVRWNTVKQYLADIGFSQEVAKTDYIPENVFYRLAMKAKNETAERFQALVADEVIPTIRKTGGYVQAGREEEFIERYFPAFSDETKLIMVKDLRAQVLALKADNAKQQAQLAEQQPKVEFADHVADSKTLLTVSAFAKIVQNENIKLGRNKLMAWLRDSGYLRANNEPYQQYIKQGLFRVREVYVNGIFYPVTFVTGKGQLYLVEKLKAEFCAA